MINDSNSKKFTALPLSLAEAKKIMLSEGYLSGESGYDDSVVENYRHLTWKKGGPNSYLAEHDTLFWSGPDRICSETGKRVWDETTFLDIMEQSLKKINSNTGQEKIRARKNGSN